MKAIYSINYKYTTFALLVLCLLLLGVIFGRSLKVQNENKNINKVEIIK